MESLAPVTQGTLTETIMYRFRKTDSIVNCPFRLVLPLLEVTRAMRKPSNNIASMRLLDGYASNIDGNYHE